MLRAMPFKYLLIAGMVCTALSGHAECPGTEHGQVMTRAPQVPASGQPGEPLRYAANTQDQTQKPGAETGNTPQESPQQASEAKQKAALEAYDPAEANKPAESWFGCSQGTHHQGGDEKDCLPQNQDKTQTK